MRRRVVSRFVLVGGMLLSTAIATEANGARQPDFLTFGRVRALIISPHPDDATLAAGGLIERVLHEGGSVRVIQVTSGDAFSKGLSSIRPRIRATAPTYRWYGSLREREAIRAMRPAGRQPLANQIVGIPRRGFVRPRVGRSRGKRVRIVIHEARIAARFRANCSRHDVSRRRPGE